jgi:glutathione S-transferase
MIQLHALPPAFGLRNTGPFALKCEMALVHLGLEFELVHQGDPRTGPKGKLPFLRAGDTVIADSELILQHLDARTDGGLYGHLSDAQRADGVAFSRLAEEHLYWIGVASRWLDDDWFPLLARGFFGAMPVPVRWIAPRLARREVRRTYHLQGLGRHTLDEQKDFARRDLDAIARKVAAGPFLLGDAVNAYDFAVAALIAGFLDNQPATWATRVVREFPLVVDYVERVQAAVGVWGREAP